MNNIQTTTKFSCVDFSGLSLKNKNLSGITFKKCLFRGADLTEVDFTLSTIVDCDFTGAVIDGAQFNRAYHKGSCFYGCNHFFALWFIPYPNKQQLYYWVDESLYEGITFTKGSPDDFKENEPGFKPYYSTSQFVRDLVRKGEIETDLQFKSLSPPGGFDVYSLDYASYHYQKGDVVQYFSKTFDYEGNRFFAPNVADPDKIVFRPDFNTEGILEALDQSYLLCNIPCELSRLGSKVINNAFYPNKHNYSKQLLFQKFNPEMHDFRFLK